MRTWGGSCHPPKQHRQRFRDYTGFGVGVSRSSALVGGGKTVRACVGFGNAGAECVSRGVARCDKRHLSLRSLGLFGLPQMGRHDAGAKAGGSCATNSWVSRVVWGDPRKLLAGEVVNFWSGQGGAHAGLLVVCQEFAHLPHFLGQFIAPQSTEVELGKRWC